MPVVKLVNQANQPVSDLELSDRVFAAKVNAHVIWEAVQSHLANARRGTASTKTRGEVSGGGAKPWRQKGTGRARAGSNRSPLWYKGGVTFGPKPRDYTWEMPRKLRRAALRGALTAKLADGELVVLDALSLDQAKTKTMASVLAAFEPKGKITLILGEHDETLRRAGRNLRRLRVINPENLNTYDVVDCSRLLLTRAAVDQIEARLGA